MANKVRGSRGKKANLPLHPFTQELKNHSRRSSAPSTMIRSAEAAPFYDCFNGEETKEDHIIPRKSLTLQQHLKLFPQTPLSTIQIKSRQLDKELFKRTGQISLIEVTDEKVLKMSDKNLLRRDKPFAPIEEVQRKIKRQTSVTKKIRVDEDASFRGGEQGLKGLEIED